MVWFARAFAGAVIAHMVGNPVGWRAGDTPLALTVTSVLLGLSALVLLVRPNTAALGSTAGLTLVSLWLEMPMTGNHWLLMGFVAAAVLIALPRAAPWPWLSVTGRWILLGFYCFAAFAKLNEGFLDPEVSCGVFYANQSLSSFGLPTFSSGGLLARIAVFGPMLTELSVPVLLAFTRTRRAGVLLALCFHTLISLDLHQHFYDFTAVLMLLLLLFLPDETTSDLHARATRASRVRSLAFTLAAVLVASSLVPPTIATAVVIKILVFAVWLPFAVWLIVRTAQGGLGPSSVPMRLPGVAAIVVVILVVANALTPYLEVKTSLGFNMYANLVTVAGETNHLVVPKTLHLSSAQDRLLEVVRTDDEGLRAYATQGYALPERNLLDYLARHPDVEVTVRRSGVEETLGGADGDMLPLLTRKFFTFRAVDTRHPPACQSAWLPAY
ncbi:hypothetical protein ACS3YM_10500 [Nocardia sp. N13]|uniref:hypothetical protein n=1 Tax=Nocardioides sp. N13(2025) TaxID=3453405 RepID=UPI003F763A19